MAIPSVGNPRSRRPGAPRVVAELTPASTTTGGSHRWSPSGPAVQGVPPRSPRRRRSRLRRGDRLWLGLLLTPYLLGFVVLIAYPAGTSLLGSFRDWPLFGEATWVGLDNYQRLVADPGFWQAVRNTLLYVALLVPAELVVGLGLALFLNRELRGVAVYRSAYFAPFVLSLAAVGLVWTWFLSPDWGLFNQFLGVLGLPQPYWLADPRFALPGLALTSVWRNSGYYMIIYLAGLQSIDREMEEAALVDGANAWQRFRHVILPLLTPTTFFAVLLGIILGFQVFDLTYVMTKGGPVGSTDVLVYFIYTTAFRSGDLGYASAIAFALLVLMVVLTACYFALESRWVHYADDGR